jgi:excisionase family DNA binding protein
VIEAKAAPPAAPAAVPLPFPEEPDELLTVPEAARELRRSESHVREQCRLGALKALRDGHGYRIRRSALRAYERKRTAA